MHVNPVGFETSFKQHLDAEQRRAVLEAIGGRINPDSTIGEVLDAAEALGWSEKMGNLSLADLAEALLAPEPEPAPAPASLSEAEDEDEVEDEDEDEDEAEDEAEDEDEEEDEDEDEDEEFALTVQEPTPRRKKSTKKATKKKATKKKATKKKATKKATKKKATKKATKKKATKKKSGRRKQTAADVDVDERMSLEQAAEFFVPHVEALGEATMQALEEETGVSRRKLRFHIGQLVKHGYLERHGMGRGTFYTSLE